jgi:hypothetical protein
MKPQPGDISIVDKTGTFLLWYNIARYPRLTLFPLDPYHGDSTRRGDSKRFVQP